ncbi:transposase [Virgibacillus halodenitrificans]|nr:transposase [Virgibacillus halodenitrificans]
MLRGANRQEIFHDEQDNLRFLETIKRYKRISSMQVYAWCLMGNHVHLLLKEGNEDLSVTMKRIGVSYVHYYNWKYRTTGHLFQDRFKSENVETKSYLLTVIRYIHQNPVKAEIVQRVDDWKWSSCLGYYNTVNAYGDLLDRELILRMFSDDKDMAIDRFKEFNEMTNYDTCLNDRMTRRLTDEEAREKIRKILGTYEIAQVKSLPRLQRNELLRKVKKIDGLSQRQAARILGVSHILIHRA